MKTPQTRFAKRGDIHLAYQVVGEGPVDLIYSDELTPVDVMWDEPRVARFLGRLASFSRLICYDKFGTGASDGLANPTWPVLQDWSDDIRAVLDAAGSERAAVFAEGFGSAQAAFFAASNPTRVSALVLVNGYVKGLRSEDFPWALPQEIVERFMAVQEERWGSGANAEWVAPALAGDERFRRWFGLRERLGMGPRGARRAWEMLLELDIRSLLPAIQAPTLVVHMAENKQVRVGQGRFLAEHIPDAKYLELPGSDHYPWLDHADTIADEVEALVTGARRGPDAGRVLLTVLFTDIAGSTKRAAELGDRAWKSLLDAHDAVLDREIARFGGRRVTSTGDGVLATFDGPARAISCATSILEAVRPLGLEIRGGLHTGEVQLRGDDVGGLAVHIAARVSDLAAPGEVLVSRTVKDLVAGAGIRFADRGTHVLKGVPDEWQVYAAEL